MGHLGLLGVGAAGAVPWYNAGGAPNPLSVLQPKAGDGWVPINLAGSYVNRAHPGAPDGVPINPLSPPTWAAGTGWTIGGAMGVGVDSLIVPAAGYSMIIFFDCTVGGLLTSGSFVVGGRFELEDGAALGGAAYGAGGWQAVAPVQTKGALAICGQQGYRNGVADGGLVPGWTAPPALSVYLGDVNGLGLGMAQGIITAWAIWDSDVAAYIAAIDAAGLAAGLR